MAVAQLPATIVGGVGEQAVEAVSANLPGMLGGLALRDHDDEAAEILRGEVIRFVGSVRVGSNVKKFLTPPQMLDYLLAMRSNCSTHSLGGTNATSLCCTQ